MSAKAKVLRFVSKRCPKCNAPRTRNEGRDFWCGSTFNGYTDPVCDAKIWVSGTSMGVLIMRAKRVRENSGGNYVKEVQNS
jgi:hypothetical protein